MKRMYQLLFLFIAFATITSCTKEDEKPPTKSSLNSIESFKITFEGLKDADVIQKKEGNNISFSVPYKTNIKGLKPVITISDKATISPKSGEAVDFVDGVAKSFTVTAEDGAKKVYKVTITVRGEVGSGSKLKTFRSNFSWGEDILTTYKYSSSNFIEEYSVKVGKKVTVYKVVYNPKNQVVEKKSEANKESTSYKYNEKNQIVSASYKKEGKLKFSYTYTYNNAGELIKELRIDEQEKDEKKKKAVKEYKYKNGNVVFENIYNQEYKATYDDKNNPFIGIYPKAYAAIMVGIYGDEKTNKNNPITMTGADDKIKYTYNKDGYPLTASYTSYGGAANMQKTFTYY